MDTVFGRADIRDPCPRKRTHHGQRPSRYVRWIAIDAHEHDLRRPAATLLRKVACVGDQEGVLRRRGKLPYHPQEVEGHHMVLMILYGLQPEIKPVTHLQLD